MALLLRPGSLASLGPQAAEQGSGLPPRVTGQCGQSMSGLYLGNDGQLGAQVMESDVCYVEAVDADFTL